MSQSQSPRNYSMAVQNLTQAASTPARSFGQSQKSNLGFASPPTPARQSMMGAQSSSMTATRQSTFGSSGRTPATSENTAGFY